MDQIQNPRVCVIGAGIAGLSSARYLSEAGIHFTVLEANKHIGGTWRYDPRVGRNEYGLPIHTSMYRDVRTNLPKPAMTLNGFPLPEEYPSYPTWYMYYNYIKSMVKHYDLMKYIKCLHQVVSIKRLENSWEVKHKHVVTGEEFVEEYDFVIIGTGQHSKPHWPHMKGEDVFRGNIIHSHDYREPEVYKDRRVLVVGAGPSGMEIAIMVSSIARKMVHSHHSPVTYNTTDFPHNYEKKLDVKELTENGVIFVDDSYEEIDDIIYSTGYEYNFPFLNESSGLTIAARSVVPLYKHIVNINQPSMMIIGVTAKACLAVAIDAQARYAAAAIKGNFTLPTKDAMMFEWTAHADALRNEGRPLSFIHVLAQKEDEYYEALTKESGICRVPPVMYKIRQTDLKAKFDNMVTYRNYEYIVTDNHTFIKRLVKKPWRPNSITI